MAGLLASSEFGFSGEDLDRLVAGTFVERVDFHREIRSTNDRALELAAEAAGALPLLVLAESQTAGRGRGANRWWADAGALTFSLVIAADAYALPPPRWPQVALIAGLAVAEAVEDLVANSRAEIKWPNDVYLSARKVSGILVEVPRPTSGQLVLGIGLNVNNDLSAAPRDIRSAAIALCEVAPAKLPLSQVLTRLLIRLEERLQEMADSAEALRARWRQRCLLTGRSVQLRAGPHDIAGHCRGIDDEGALLIETDRGLERCFAGVVTHVGV